MSSSEQLRDLYTKIAEAQKQVVMLMNTESNRGPAKFTSLRCFMIDNRLFPNSTKKWADGLRAICDILSIIYSDQFDKVLDCPDFTKKPDTDFPATHTAYKIRNTGIFVNIQGDSNKKKRIIDRLAQLFDCQIYLDYY